MSFGKRVHRRSWTVQPNFEAAISRVEVIALEEGMPTVDHANMINEYDPDETVDDSAYDKGYSPTSASDHDSDHELTSDAYTDSSSETDADSDSDLDDFGHLAAYDDEQGMKSSNESTQMPTNASVGNERAQRPHVTVETEKNKK